MKELKSARLNTAVTPTMMARIQEYCDKHKLSSPEFARLAFEKLLKEDETEIK